MRNLLFPHRTTGTAKRLTSIRNNRQSAPFQVCENCSYSSHEVQTPCGVQQNWRFCCSGNPKIHISYVTGLADLRYKYTIIFTFYHPGYGFFFVCCSAGKIIYASNCFRKSYLRFCRTTAKFRTFRKIRLNRHKKTRHDKRSSGVFIHHCIIVYLCSIKSICNDNAQQNRQSLLCRATEHRPAAATAAKHYG